MKETWRFMRGLYLKSHVDSYLTCIRNLEGKTKTAIFYLRLHQTGTEFFPQLKAVADDCGIQLIPGIEASSYTLPSETPTSAHPVTWSRLWWVIRWQKMAETLRSWCNYFGTSYVAVVCEEAFNKADGFYTNPPKQGINWDTIGKCYKELYKQKLTPIFDMPMIWNDRKEDCETFIKTCRDAYRTLGGYLPMSPLTLPRAFWMPGYEFSPSTDAANEARHKQLVGPSRFHERIFSCIRKEHPFEFDVADTQSVIANHDDSFPPLVIYAKFQEYADGTSEDGSQLCEAL